MAFRQTGLKVGLEGFGFSLRPAVNQSVICIPTPKQVGIGPLHPQVKRVMQEQIGQMGLITPPCGVPRVLSILMPSCSMGAVSHLSM